VDAFAAARATKSGAADTTFGSGGSTTASPLISAYGHAAALAPDGGIVVVGQAQVGGEPHATATRFLPGGALDTAFGSSGATGVKTGTYSTALAVAVDAVGRTLVVGHWESTTQSSFVLMRFTATGSLDASFGDQGKVLETDPIFPLGVHVQPSGTVMVVGRDQGSDSGTVRLRRYDALGARDVTFAGGGDASVALTQTLLLYVSAADPSGGFLIGGVTGGTTSVWPPFDSTPPASSTIRSGPQASSRRRRRGARRRPPTASTSS